jgi:hypothetical protein
MHYTTDHPSTCLTINPWHLARCSTPTVLIVCNPNVLHNSPAANLDLYRKSKTDHVNVSKTRSSKRYPPPLVFITVTPPTASIISPMDLIAQDRCHAGSCGLREPKLFKRVVIPKIEEYHAIANEVERFFRGRINLLNFLSSEDHHGVMSGDIHLLSD